jgi:hypothetical protein
MKSIRSLNVCAVALLAAAAICALPGCAGKKNVWGDPESGLILEYRMKQGDMLRYEMVQEGTERVEVMGQTNESATSKSYVFTVESRGMQGKNHQLGITIESLEASLTSVQGSFDAETDGVTGKTFDMILSPLGDEVDLPGADELMYSAGPTGERGIKSDFEGAFADLPGRPVKIGDSWTSSDTISVDQGNAIIEIMSESVNTLDGYETVAGLECARVAVDVAGTISGTGEQMGAPLVFDGTLEGSETWYFAYKEGHLVKTSSDMTSDIMVTVQMGQEMKVPVKGTMRFETTLIK